MCPPNPVPFDEADHGSGARGPAGTAAVSRFMETNMTTVKTALVTAGSRGIGRKIAKRLSLDGCRVWVTDTHEESLNRLPRDWMTTRVDAADPDGMSSLFKRIANEWGRLDALCSNAGIAGPTACIEDTSVEEWRRCVSVNLEGSFLAAKGSVPIMKRQGSGVMIFTSSTAGMFGYPLRAPYASAKWGVIGLMKTLAMELGPHGIRVNAVCPGAVEGARMDLVMEREARLKQTTIEAIRAGYAAGNSLRTWITAKDVAEAVRFLVSDEAGSISGVALPVDGHTENLDPKT